MTAETDQLVVHFGQVQKVLMTCPAINIAEIHGQPPDEYEIEYHLTGYVRRDDGTIVTHDRHRIRISLPFGYPHFPPVVKPLTPVFHPDFDPEAVRIADFWKTEPALAKLILHLGEMICGKHYNLNDPFNQEAADWYAQHAEELPLDEIPFIKQPEVQDEVIDETIRQLEESVDSSTAQEKPAGSSKQGDPEEIQDGKIPVQPSPAKPEQDKRLQELHCAIEEKRFFAASHLLSQLLETTFIPECKELEQTINTAIRETDRLFKDAEQLESQGDLADALAKVETLISITSDFPGIEDVRRRIQQALAISGSMQTRGNSRRKRKFSRLESGDWTQAIPERRPRKRRSFSLKLLLICILLLVAVSMGIKFVSERQDLATAAGYLQTAEALLAKKKYSEVQAVLEKALSASSSVLFLVPQKKQLLQKISAIRSKREYVEGIRGRVLYNNEYVSSKEVSLREHLDQLIAAAEELQKNGEPERAIAGYEKAEAYAREHNLPLPEDRINQNKSQLELDLAIQAAKKAEASQDWSAALDAYQQALKLTPADGQLAAELKERLVYSALAQKVEVVKETAAAADWQQVRALVKELEDVMEKKSSLVAESQQEEIRYLGFQAELNLLLAEAKTAYQEGRLDRSIQVYEQALAVVENGKKQFSEVTAASVEKVNRTLHMVKIAREQNMAGAAEEKGDLQGAITHYQNILQLIANGPFEQNEAMQTLARNTRLQIRAKTNQLVLDNKIKWLLENYVTLFQQNYPAILGSELSNPEAEFLRKEDGKLLFKISCREEGQGAPTRLELEYQFDPETGRWSLYNGQ